MPSTAICELSRNRDIAQWFCRTVRSPGQNPYEDREHTRLRMLQLGKLGPIGHICEFLKELLARDLCSAGTERNLHGLSLNEGPVREPSCIPARPSANSSRIFVPQWQADH